MTARDSEGRRRGRSARSFIRRHRAAPAIPSAALALALAALASVPAAAADEPDRSVDPAGTQVLGNVFAAGPSPPALLLLSSGGYGYTGDVLGQGDAHHRLSGRLGIEGRPTSWLGLGLHLDGRYDRHTLAGMPDDDGLVGDPRAFVRVDGAVTGTLRLGARLGLWLPGRNAPSVDFSALTTDLLGVATYVARDVPIAVSVNVGYRLDRGANAAPDARRLSASDRLALELSDFDQALVGVAAAVGRRALQGFVEASGDLLVGSNAPPLSQSPLRIGAGARWAAAARLQLEAEGIVAASARPTISATSPLVPVPPRAELWLGIAYRFGAGPGEGKPAAAKTTPVDVSPPASPSPPPPPPPQAEGRGMVSSNDGGALVALRVEMTTQASGAVALDVDSDGRFTFTGPPGETVSITAAADGYNPATATVTLRAGEPNQVSLMLQRKLPSGQLRGLVRSFKGRAVSAEIRVEPTGQVLQAHDGQFQIDVSPGRYDVTITAPGFESQTRQVQVEQNGVTVLNVDLRAAKH